MKNEQFPNAVRRRRPYKVDTSRMQPDEHVTQIYELPAQEAEEYPPAEQQMDPFVALVATRAPHIILAVLLLTACFLIWS